MKTLTIDQLHDLRNAVFDNAESFYKEAKILHDAGFYARAYLSAYYTMEELGKLPMIVGATAKKMNGEDVDWKKLRKRMNSHMTKVEAEIHHHYVWGLDVCPENTDVDWYENKTKEVKKIYAKKNSSTYVDVVDGRIVNPVEVITEKESEAAINEAFEFLKAHWKSETMSNPKLKSEPVGPHNSGQRSALTSA